MRVDVHSPVPIYVQLAEQLKYLVSTGELASGTRLPSARLLARNLNVNRNTVLRAYSVLRRDGYVEGRRGAGTTVKLNPGEDPAAGRPTVGPTLARLLDELVVEGETLGLSADDLAALVTSHASMRETRPVLRIVFVECNPQSLAHFVPSIERLGVNVEGVLLDDLIEELQSGRLEDVDAFASTFFHLSEVRRYLRDAGYDHELFAVGVRPHVSVLNALEGLKDGSQVGVVYYAAPDDAYAPARLRRMSEAIELGLPNLRVVPLLLTEIPSGVGLLRSRRRRRPPREHRPGAIGHSTRSRGDRLRQRARRGLPPIPRGGLRRPAKQRPSDRVGGFVGTVGRGQSGVVPSVSAPSSAGRS